MARPSKAEARMGELLDEQLPEPFVVYRSVAWVTKRPDDEPRDGEADFVVAHPELGIMVIEVKGGGIRRTGGQWESVDRTRTPRRIKDPFLQVTREMHTLKRIAEDRPEWPVHSIRFCRAVALPNTRYDRALTADGPPEMVIDSTHLGRLEARIREIFDWWTANPAYRGGAPGAAGMRALHALLAQDFEIPSPLQLQLAEDEREILRLSEQQYATLDALRAQRRALILGVAGSGKTMLAVEQARRMAAADNRVLLTCFNRPLAEHLRAGIGQTDGVDVHTFHGLAEHMATEADIAVSRRHDDPGYFDIELPQALADAAKSLDRHRYDAIVVDEAQDIDSVWWLPLLDLLADPQHGTLFVFGDANQDLYHADPEEIGVVMPERPPVYLLEENRRTTRAIHEFAHGWASPRPIQTDAGELTIHPRAAGPEGRPVEHRTYPEGDADACRWLVASVLKELTGPGGGVPWSEVVVLTPRSARTTWLAGKVGSFTLVPEAGPEGAPLPWPTRPRDVRLSTIHRFKGLEASVVVLAEMDGRVAQEQVPGLMYVGATRARTHLVVIGSQDAVSHSPG